MSRHKEAESQYRIVLALDSKNIVAKQNLQKLEEHNCYNSTLP